MMKVIFSSIIDFSYGFVKPQLVVDNVLVKFDPYFDDPYGEVINVDSLTILFYKDGRLLDTADINKSYSISIGKGLYQFEVNQVANNTFNIIVKRDMAQ